MARLEGVFVKTNVVVGGVTKRYKGMSGSQKRKKNSETYFMDGPLLLFRCLGGLSLFCRVTVPRRRPRFREIHFISPGSPWSVKNENLHFEELFVLSMRMSPGILHMQ